MFMFFRFPSALLAIGMAAGWALPAVAQPGPPHGAHAMPATLPASAAMPAQPPGVQGYRSAFDTYRRYADAPVVSWKEANEQVARIGGWQAYAREAAGASGASGAPQPAAAGDARAGQAGHRH
jgi:hypothetical protein